MSGHRQSAAWLAGVTAMLAVAAQAGAQKSPVPADSSGVPRLSQEQFRALHTAKSVLTVDVRNAVAYEAGRIPGAIHVPLSEIDRRAADLIALAKDRAIVTYCSCPAEHSAAEAGWILMKHGARDVRALVGGFVDWSRNGGKIER